MTLSQPRYYLVEIKVDGIVTGRVGPFDAECVADMYCSAHLEPAFPDATFYITDMDSPASFLNVLACLPKAVDVLAGIGN
jgi:hypothetical protein